MYAQSDSPPRTGWAQEAGVHMLYLLRSGQVQTRQAVAPVLGVSHNTISRWLTTYETGSLPALLDIYVPAGKQPSLPPEVLASIEQALRRPEGFASYTDLQQWVEQNHHRHIKYKTLYTLVRSRFNAKLKVPHPSHTKNDDAVHAFQRTCVTHFQHAIPAENHRAVKVFAQDESR